MSVDSPPAIAGGTPVRSRPLSYGRHQLEDSDIAAVVNALRSGTLAGGAGVADFEHTLEERCRVGNAVAAANGSVAIDLAVVALGIGPGDEVATTPLTFVATANAIARVGATPVFADTGDDRCLDPAPADCDLAVNPSPGGDAMRPSGADTFLGGATSALLRASFLEARETVLRRGAPGGTVPVSTGARDLDAWARN